MCKRLTWLALVFTGCWFRAQADVLMVADEFPAMEYVASQLQAQHGVASRIVAQTNLPPNLALYQAVVVYIHLGLAPSAEEAFIEYARGGGRLVLLHHSISSGKRQNKHWFEFLGVNLPQGDVEKGGYKWIEGVSAQWVRLSTASIMTQGVEYGDRVPYASPAAGEEKNLPGFTLVGTEVYLNHVLIGEHTPLLGLKYADPKTGKVWMQGTAGWTRMAGKGRIFYFMPGHTVHDFENPAYGRIVLNAIIASTEPVR